MRIVWDYNILGQRYTSREEHSKIEFKPITYPKVETINLVVNFCQL